MGRCVPKFLQSVRFSGLLGILPGAVTKAPRLLAVSVAVVAGVAVWLIEQPKAVAQVSPAGPMPVRVEVARPQTVHPWAHFSGRISAVDYAEIRPQVAGRITDIRFRDGAHVKAGDILFVIDPRPYQAAQSKAEGELTSAINTAKLADLELARGKRLMQAHALSQENYDQRVSADAVAKAAVKSAAAALDQARVSVDYAYVKAPISGRISRPEITLGNFVGTTPTPPLLASVVSDSGVYADFEVDEQTYLNSVRSSGGTATPVELVVDGDHTINYRGSIYSFDNHIDPASGTIRARARFVNADGTLMPGMFVSVRMGGNVIHNALLVPQSAIGADQNKRFVYLVGHDNKVEYREVTLGDEVDGKRVISTGLKPGDKVILDGQQRLVPGVPVAVIPTPRMMVSR